MITSAATVLSTTSSLCPTCKRGVAADIVELDGRILMRKTCPDHGPSEVLIASDAAWYHRTMAFPAVLKAPVATKPVSGGCPYDCGACSSHQQAVYLPVIPITSACNLNCPICYTINKNEGAHHISLDEFKRTLDVIKRNDPAMKIINLTGGEPTMHPQLVEIIRLCHDAGLHRVTISTHGLTFIKDTQLLAALAELDARMVLSFDSFDELTNKKMLGAKLHSSKMAVLEQFERFNVATTLLAVVAMGVNDQEVGSLLDLALSRPFIRSLEVHTMTFTGQGGKSFDQTARITTPEVLRRIAGGSSGRIRIEDFTPSPCAHPLCYQTCYLLQTGAQDFVPFARFMSIDNIRHLLTDNLYMEPGERMETVVRQVIDELWAMAIPSATSATVLAALKQLLHDLFPARALPYHRQQIIAERSAKTIYLHSHMDEGNFDTDRIRQCCVGVPSADGGNTPTCSYNILYRERDPRFSTRQVPPLSTLPGGRIWKP